MGDISNPVVLNLPARQAVLTQAKVLDSVLNMGNDMVSYGVTRDDIQILPTPKVVAKVWLRNAYENVPAPPPGLAPVFNGGGFYEDESHVTSEDESHVAAGAAPLMVSPGNYPAGVWDWMNAMSGTDRGTNIKHYASSVASTTGTGRVTSLNEDRDREGDASSVASTTGKVTTPALNEEFYASLPRHSSYKTMYCRWAILGTCRHQAAPDLCSYAHPGEALRKKRGVSASYALAAAKSTTGHLQQNGAAAGHFVPDEMKNNNHDNKGRRMQDELDDKHSHTKFCAFFFSSLQGVCCPATTNCPFSHGPANGTNFSHISECVDQFGASLTTGTTRISAVSNGSSVNVIAQ